MKKTWKILMTLLLCLAFCTGAFACRINTQNPGNTVPEVPDDPGTGDIEISVGVLMGEFERNIMLKWKNAFQKLHPEVSIKLTAQLGAMEDVVTIESGGKLPDICWTSGDQHSPYSKKYFTDLSQLEGADEFFSGFYDELIDSTHVSTNDTGIWFVPRDYNALVVYYNKTLFKEANVALPAQGWTWEQFESTCKALNDSGKVMSAVEYDVAWPPFSLTMMSNFGSQYFNDSGKIILDSTETENCFNTLRTFNNNYATQGTGGNFSRYTPGGKTNVGMFIDVRPSLPELASRASAVGWELGAVSFPNYKVGDRDGYVGVGCSGYAITKACTDETKKAWAWKFLQYCMSQEGYEEASDQGVLVPALKDLADKGSWRTYEYNGIKVNPDAFVRTDATPIFLNYYNMHNTNQHANITKYGTIFWGNVKPGAVDSYRTSMNAYLQFMKDTTGITK